MNTALVTGSAGFVGRHMTTALRQRGWVVTGVDIADHADALTLFRNQTWRYDLVVHAAARSPHRAAIDGVPGIFPYNMMLDAAMFDWAVRTKQSRVLYLSSSAAYPTSFQDGTVSERLRELDVRFDFVGSPDSSYGWTKLTGERMAGAARDAGVPVTVVRPFSGYGEDQSEDFPFRAIIERARRWEDPFTIWGDGTQVRDWVHIDDVVAGALALVDADAQDPVNLCTGRGVSMHDLATLACEQVGYRPGFSFDHDRPAGVAYRVGDPTRLHESYQPKVTVEEGVKRALM